MFCPEIELALETASVALQCTGLSLSGNLAEMVVVCCITQLVTCWPTLSMTIFGWLAHELCTESSRGSRYQEIALQDFGASTYRPAGTSESLWLEQATDFSVTISSDELISVKRRAKFKFV